MTKNVDKAYNYQKNRRKKFFRRQILTAGIAAAAMSVTVFATARLLLTERALKKPVSPWIRQETDNTEEHEVQVLTGETSLEDPAISYNYWWTDAELSIMGSTDSAEYKAWEEWMRYQDEYDARGKLMRGEIEEDKENPPKAPYIFYDAFTPDMAKRLDEIAEKYQLSLHTTSQSFSDQKGLCDLLDIDIFLDGAYDVSGYVYEDGTFVAEGFRGLVQGDRYFSMFVQPKGSFTAISEPLYDPEELEAWIYETEDGSEVTLVYGPRACYILAETGNAAFTGFWHTIAEDGKSSLDREQLEKLADGIRFSVLAEKYKD